MVGGYLGYQRIGGARAAEVTPNRQLVQVQRSRLTAAVSTTGNLVMPSQAKLAFGTAGMVAEVNVRDGDRVEKGQPLAKLDRLTVASLEKTVAQVRLDLKKAQDDLDTAQNPYSSTDLAKGEADVTNAQVAINTASDQLEKAITPYTETVIEDARAQVRNAQVSLDGATDNLEVVRKSDPNGNNLRKLEYEYNYYESKHGEMLNKFSEGKASQDDIDRAWNNLVTAKEKLDSARIQSEMNLRDAENKVKVAQESLVKAKDHLNDVLAEPDSLIVEQRQKQLTVAQLTLKDAEKKLADMRAGAEPLNVAVKKAEIARAQIALDNALESLNKATMVAPFPGIVSKVDAEIGDSVASNKVIVTLIDPSTVEMNAVVDETDVAKVKPGQEVAITMDALPNVSLRGKINSIAATATRTQGVVNYNLRVGVTPQRGVELKEGLTALANIVVEQRDNVLVVPSRAVKTSGREKVVQVMVDGTPQARVVKTGMSDERNMEITDGLKEGETVVVETSTTSGPLRVPGGFGQGGFGGPVMVPGR